MDFRFSPFNKPVGKICGEDLAVLRDIREGWYVEYKREPVPLKAIAKSISAFANQYGGWLFFGIGEDAKNNTAASFSGISEMCVKKLLEDLRNASNSHTTPSVFYEVVEIKGPVDGINLEAGNSIVVVRVPVGNTAPYIHSDGRIYRRVADASEPRPETDRHLLDALWRRGESARLAVMEKFSELPTVSEGERETPFLHIHFWSDPFQTKGHYFAEDFETFRKCVEGAPIPCDNIFTMSGGFVARQVGSNNPVSRVLTWEFSRDCHSLVTLPLNYAEGGTNLESKGYKYVSQFIDEVIKQGYSNTNIIDLNAVLEVLIAISMRHRTLAQVAGINGPFFVKIYFENLWRTAPYIDLSSYLKHIIGHRIPLIQKDNFITPVGHGIDSFIFLEELESPSSENFLGDAIAIGCRLLDALGVPMTVLKDGADEISELYKRMKNSEGKDFDE